MKPLKQFLCNIPFNIYTMVVGETTKGHFNQIEPNSNSQDGVVCHFQDHFLVNSQKKADYGQLVFKVLNKSLVFGVFLSNDIWIKLQALEDKKVYSEVI